MLLTHVTGSIFLGLSLAKIIADFAVFKKGLNFFSEAAVKTIPGFSAELAQDKTFDSTYVFLAILASVVIFSFNLIVTKSKNFSPAQVSTLYILFSVMMFFETHFVGYSGIRNTILIFTLQVLYLAHSKYFKKSSSHKPDFYTTANGLFAGTYLLIVLNLLTTSLVIPIAALLGAPIIFSVYSNNSHLRSPALMILLLPIFFPFNKTLIVIILIAAFFGVYLFKLTKFNMQERLKLLIYKVVILIVVIYNPLFYFGNFDSVEEGFWLGWLQRLINGEVIYRDFVNYHPPLILWGLAFFEKIFGYTIYNLRAYLHLLQIGGSIIIFFTLEKLVRNPWLKILTFWLILSLLTKTVQNNVEIRIGMGLLATFPIYYYIKNTNVKLIFFSGVMASVSIFTSLEVGLLVSAAISIFLFLEKPKNLLSILKKQLVLGSGLTIGSIPILSYLYTKGALPGFFDQMLFYTKAFSDGYLNSNIVWPENLTLLQWHVVNRFFSSPAFLWYLALGGIITALMVYMQKSANNILSRSDKYLLLMCILSLLLLRPVLGRSDSYHLLTILPIAICLLAYAFENLFYKNIHISYFLLIILGLFFLRESTQTAFFQTQFIKLQTYGNPEGQYPSYASDRTGILVGIEIDTLNYDQLLNFIKSNSQKNDYIFTYPWMPEIYFLTDRRNATPYDTPLAFFTSEHQDKMISQLKAKPPKIIVYNPKQNLGNLNAGSLPKVQEFIKTNYSVTKRFNDIEIFSPNKY